MIVTCGFFKLDYRPLKSDSFKLPYDALVSTLGLSWDPLSHSGCSQTPTQSTDNCS